MYMILYGWQFLRNILKLNLSVCERLTNGLCDSWFKAWSFTRFSSELSIVPMLAFRSDSFFDMLWKKVVNYLTNQKRYFSRFKAKDFTCFLEIPWSLSCSLLWSLAPSGVRMWLFRSESFFDMLYEWIQNLRKVIFIGPESDHWLCLSLTP